MNSKSRKKTSGTNNYFPSERESEEEAADGELRNAIKSCVVNGTCEQLIRSRLSSWDASYFVD